MISISDSIKDCARCGLKKRKILRKKDMVKLFLIVEQIKEEILKSRRKVLKKE